MNELLAKLAAPFEPSAITWKPGHVKDNQCMALAYGDLRAYLNRLDEVCGADWSVEYQPWGDNRIIARLTIGGVTRCSTGEMGSQDVKNEMGGTVAEAQAFKRAASMFGLGRYLYELPSVWVEFDAQRKRITDNGQRELDRRYREWYAKQVPAQVSDNPPVDSAYVDVDYSEEASPHQRLWAAGLKCFHDDWDMARPWVLGRWTEKVSQPKRTSAADLSDAEKSQVATYIEEKSDELRKVWPRQKAIMIQTTN